jgi:hypothetical protein
MAVWYGDSSTSRRNKGMGEYNERKVKEIWKLFTKQPKNIVIWNSICIECNEAIQEWLQTQEDVRIYSEGRKKNRLNQWTKFTENQGY